MTQQQLADLVGVVMVLALVFGTTAIRLRNFIQHGAWMLRAYALGIGAGTQVFTHLPWFLLPAMHGEGFRALYMGAGWAINIMIAEWIIRTRIAPQRKRRYPANQLNPKGVQL